MAYYLRQDKKKNGIYLQMYENYWDKEKKQPRSKNIESFGYVSKLTSETIPDPIAYYKEYVQKKNEEKAIAIAEETRPRAFNCQQEKNIGYFLISSLISELNVKETIDILAFPKKFQFSIYDMLVQLIYSRILYPCSKSKTVSSVFPRLYNGVAISDNQVYDGCAFIGESYKKYIELFNHCYEQFYKRNLDNVFLTVLIIILKLMCQKTTNKKVHQKKIEKSLLLGKLYF